MNLYNYFYNNCKCHKKVNKIQDNFKQFKKSC